MMCLRRYVLRIDRVGIALGGLLALLLCVADATAIPLFARKFGTTCFTCHTSEPLLNDFGRRFQAAGFQIPGASADPTSQADQGAFPIALIAHPRIVWDQTQNRLTDSAAVARTMFSGVELALFSTGHLGPHFSYFVETPIAISAREVSVDVVTAEVLYTDVLNDGLSNLNFRIGKIGPMVAYPANVMLSSVDPLVDTYSPIPQVDSPLNTFTLLDPMFGVSAFGLLPQVLEGLRCELGFYGGNLSDIDLASGHGIFLSLDQTVYLENAPLRFGVSYLGGAQSIQTVRSTGPAWQNAMNRISVDLDITDPWTKRVQLSMQYVRGFDSNIDSTSTAVHSDMILLGTQVIILPERFYAYARLDYAEGRPLSDIHRQYDVGVRYHLLPNVVLSLGASRTIQTQPGLNDWVTTSASCGVLFGF